MDNFQRLYSELLDRGKDLYILGSDPLWILGLNKIKREPVEDYKSSLYQFLHIEGLEKILKGKPFMAYKLDIDIH